MAPQVSWGKLLHHPSSFLLHLHQESPVIGVPPRRVFCKRVKRLKFGSAIKYKVVLNMEIVACDAFAEGLPGPQ